MLFFMANVMADAMITRGVGQIVIPGDSFLIAPSQSSNIKNKDEEALTILGPGLYSTQRDIVAVTHCGILRSRKPNIYWVDSSVKRYIPSCGESVIGIVKQRAGEYFRVDINAQELAILSFMAFEGATKKNRPELKPGDLVYAKVLSVDRYDEPELVCMDNYGKSSGFGILSQKEGFMITASSSVIKKLVQPNCGILQSLAKSLQFEIAIGTNNRIWIDGRNVKDVITVCEAIGKCEMPTEEDKQQSQTKQFQTK